MQELEITVPETFAAGIDLLDVTHIKPDLQTRQNLTRLDQAAPKERSSKPSIVQLDISVSAPRRIFVRGRGLDAELGGTIKLTGPITDISPIGAFTLIRGRLEILNKRFDLESGQVSFVGDLDPQLDFVAKTQAGDVEASIIIAGQPSDISVSFTSTPELPEDEVLARLIFDRGITDLSPVQIARLASAVGELAGGPSINIIGDLRSVTKLDDLDVVTDEQGETAVKAGKYINDNVYVGVAAGQEAEATINLDITKNITARGSVNSEGNTSISVFFERDY